METTSLHESTARSGSRRPPMAQKCQLSQHKMRSNSSERSLQLPIRQQDAVLANSSSTPRTSFKNIKGTVFSGTLCLLALVCLTKDVPSRESIWASRALEALGDDRTKKTVITTTPPRTDPNRQFKSFQAYTTADIPLSAQNDNGPLILDAALGLVPPKPPEGKDYLPLEFVHATKTGGSAIEKAAAKHGIAWGACHYNCGSFNDMKCPSRSPPQYFEGRVMPTRYAGTVLWHVPPRYWSPNLLEGHKTFTVVRNPYSRAVSEYYNKWDGFAGTVEERNDPANLNAWIQTNLIDRPKGIRYLQHSKYVYDDDGKKVVDVVLHFENLAAEFNELMESEGLPIRLDNTPFNERTGSSLLGVEDLTNATIKKINDYAMDDFINFDYKPMLI